MAKISELTIHNIESVLPRTLSIIAFIAEIINIIPALIAISAASIPRLRQPISSTGIATTAKNRAAAIEENITCL